MSATEKDIIENAEIWAAHRKAAMQYCPEALETRFEKKLERQIYAMAISNLPGLIQAIGYAITGPGKIPPPSEIENCAMVLDQIEHNLRKGEDSTFAAFTQTFSVMASE